MGGSRETPCLPTGRWMRRPARIRLCKLPSGVRGAYRLSRLEGVLVPKSGSNSPSVPASRVAPHHPRRAQLRHADEVPLGHPRAEEARPARHPGEVIASMGPMPGARVPRRPARHLPGGDPVRHLLRVRQAVDEAARHADAVLPQPGGRRRGILVDTPAHADQKREAVKRFRELVSGGRGRLCNDTAMLGEAHGGIRSTARRT